MPTPEQMLELSSSEFGILASIQRTREEAEAAMAEKLEQARGRVKALEAAAECKIRENITYRGRLRPKQINPEAKA